VLLQLDRDTGAGRGFFPQFLLCNYGTASLQRLYVIGIFIFQLICSVNDS
jgi:hypothetical protein